MPPSMVSDGGDETNFPCHAKPHSQTLTTKPSDACSSIEGVQLLMEDDTSTFHTTDDYHAGQGRLLSFGRGRMYILKKE